MPKPVVANEDTISKISELSEVLWQNTNFRSMGEVG